MGSRLANGSSQFGCCVCEMCDIVSLANALTSVKHLVEKQCFSKPSCTLERFSAKIQSFLVDCTYYQHLCLRVNKLKSRCLHVVSRAHLISVFLVSQLRSKKLHFIPLVADTFCFS